MQEGVDQGADLDAKIRGPKPTLTFEASMLWVRSRMVGRLECCML